MSAARHHPLLLLRRWQGAKRACSSSSSTAAAAATDTAATSARSLSLCGSAARSFGSRAPLDRQASGSSGSGDHQQQQQRAGLTTSAAPAAASAATTTAAAPPPTPTIPPHQARWVFLGPPGVGKGTYASRVAAALGVAHVAAGDLVRAEIKAGTPLGQQARDAVAEGRLLPDALVLALVRSKLEALAPGGYLLDGFPRTRAQAEALFNAQASNNNPHNLLPTLAVNLSLREEVLVDKCIGRRVCGKCGKGFNVADIHLPASADKSQPEIVMPPLNPPEECASLMETREDDTEPVVRRRLDAYRREAGPVEAFFAARGALLDFEITGGIPQTLPRLAKALAPYHSGGEEVLVPSKQGSGGAVVVDKNKRDKALCGDASAPAAKQQQQKAACA